MPLTKSRVPSSNAVQSMFISIVSQTKRTAAQYFWQKRSSLGLSETSISIVIARFQTFGNNVHISLKRLWNSCECGKCKLWIRKYSSWAAKWWTPFILAFSSTNLSTDSKGRLHNCEFCAIWMPYLTISQDQVNRARGRLEHIWITSYSFMCSLHYIDSCWWFLNSIH